MVIVTRCFASVIIVIVKVGEVLMGFQDVAFLPFRSGFSTTFPINCGRVEGHGTTTCLIAVAGGRQGHAPVKYFRSIKSSFCVS